MQHTLITIGEVEHGGDVQFTRRQIAGVEGVEAVEFREYDGEWSGRFAVSHTFPRSELRERLSAAGVCV